MRIETVSIRDLSSDDVRRWNSWAAPNGALISPYLLHDFAAAVDAVRGDVRVAVAREAGETVGYFAYHTPKGGVIRPVGSPMSDYQGIVAASGRSLSPQDMLPGAHACALVYDNWLDAGVDLTRERRERDGSVVCDLSDGADAYFAQRSALHRDHFKKMARRLKQAERDFGPAHFVFGDPTGDHYAMLKAWKGRQYRTTGKLDVLSVGWADRLLGDLRRREGSPFGTLTAALYFGDRLAAVEIGLKAGGVYHSWFPAYDPVFARVSPGLMLIHGVIEHADRLNYSRVDLGRGSAQYKKYYASYEVPLDSGRVLEAGMASALIRGWEAAEACARVLPESLSQVPVRLRRRWAQVSAFEPELPARIGTLARSLRTGPQAA